MLIGVLFLSLGFYMYFIRTTIHNVVVREITENEISRLTIAIGRQEFEYINKRNAITLSLAHSLGFKDAQVKTYISKNPDTKVAFLSH